MSFTEKDDDHDQEIQELEDAFRIKIGEFKTKISALESQAGAST